MPSDWGVVGQSVAVGFLQRSISSGRTRQAYLFTGPPQIGKATLALAFSQALNCDDPESPCGNCRSCQKIARGTHPDVRTLGLIADDKSEAGRLKKNIGIAQIQELPSELALQPYEGRVRVVIIDGAELLTVEAANALLKTLEEPPERAVLIVLTTDPSLLLPTVVSRCQRVELRLASTAAIESALVERWKADGDEAAVLARIASGRIGWAIAALADRERLEARSDRIDTLASVLREGLSDRMGRAGKLATRFAASREEVYQTLETWQSWLRDVLVIRVAGSPGESLIANIDRLPEIRRASEDVTAVQVREAIQALRICRTQLEQNVSPRLALEAALLSMPRAA